jgi:hypothetical protein
MDNRTGEQGGLFRMATVRCEVCGGIFNQSYLASHSRLAHGKSKGPTVREPGEDQTVRTIVSLYEELSPEGRKRAMRLLAGKNRKKEETSGGG